MADQCHGDDGSASSAADCRSWHRSLSLRKRRAFLTTIKSYTYSQNANDHLRLRMASRMIRGGHSRCNDGLGKIK